MEYKLCNLEELEKFASDLIEKLQSKHKNLLILKGNLGAGKTTLVKKIAKVLGVKEEVNSPTFVVMKEYETKHSYFKKLIHIDAYRMESKEDLKLFSVEELLKDKESLVCVEWAENIEADKIEDSEILSIEIVDDNCRLIKLL